jgi:hypothetical protein
LVIGLLFRSFIAPQSVHANKAKDKQQEDHYKSHENVHLIWLHAMMAHTQLLSIAAHVPLMVGFQNRFRHLTHPTGEEQNHQECPCREHRQNEDGGHNDFHADRGKKISWVHMTVTETKLCTARIGLSRCSHGLFLPERAYTLEFSV